jgi:hypothetical protein
MINNPFKSCTCGTGECRVHPFGSLEALARERAKTLGPQLFDLEVRTGAEENMSAEQAVIFLKGMIEAIQTAEPTPKQWLKIKDAVMGVPLTRLKRSGDRHAG